jgi:ADP-ribose pyrophosphatase YjhB (NUDIX family)
MQKERGNGANVIVLSPTGEILVVQQNYGEGKWMLPGGEIERGESASHAGQEETEEESGIWIDATKLRLIAFFVQRPKGFVFLFEAKEFSGEISGPTSEIAEIKFMSFREILDSKEKFGLAYIRMITHYMRCIKGIDLIPFEGRLCDPVDYPKDSNEDYRNLVLVV